MSKDVDALLAPHEPIREAVIGGLLVTWEEGTLARHTRVGEAQLFGLALGNQPALVVYLLDAGYNSERIPEQPWRVLLLEETGVGVLRDRRSGGPRAIPTHIQERMRTVVARA